MKLVLAAFGAALTGGLMIACFCLVGAAARRHYPRAATM